MCRVQSALSCVFSSYKMNIDDHPQSPSVYRKTIRPPGEGWRVRRPLDFLVPWDSITKISTKTEPLVIVPERKKD